MRPILANPLDALIVRDMKAEDRLAVVRLFAELIQHEAGLDPSVTPFVEDRTNSTSEAENYLKYCEARVSSEGGALRVAETNSSVRGFLCWIISHEGPFVREEFRTVGEVLFVIVSSSHRGKGIGRRLMQDAEHLTNSAGLSRLSLMVMAGNTQAVRVYEKDGYKVRAFKMLKKM